MLPAVYDLIRSHRTTLVFVNSRGACERLTAHLNEAYAATWASMGAPMGGMKDSGVGRRHGAEGILKYTESQNVTVQHVMPIAP